MIRVTNDKLARYLHSALYDRLHAFCMRYTCEIPADLVVSTWMNRLFNNDPRLHILVELDEQYNITEHAVIDVQEAFGINIVYCYQVQRDKPDLSSFTEGIEYIDKLVALTNASCSVIYVDKHEKALSDHYGYTTVRKVMIKYNPILNGGDSNERPH